MLLNTVNAAALGLPRNWHGLLVTALATKDPDVAERAMRKHVQFNVSQQIEMLEASRLIETGASTLPMVKTEPKSTPRKTARNGG